MKIPPKKTKCPPTLTVLTPPPEIVLTAAEARIVSALRAMDRTRQDHMHLIALALASEFPARAQTHLRLISGGAQ